MSENRTVILLRTTNMGEGDDALGARLMGSFLRTLTTLEPKPETLIFYNSAVKILATNSPHLEALKALDDAGVDLLACVTCLEHFTLTEELAIGQISNMREIVQTIMSATKCVTI